MKKCKDCLENFVKKEQPNGYYLIYIGNNIIVGQKVLSQNGKNINSSDYDKYCFILLKQFPSALILSRIRSIHPSKVLTYSFVRMDLIFVTVLYSIVSVISLGKRRFIVSKIRKSDQDEYRRIKWVIPCSWKST